MQCLSKFFRKKLRVPPLVDPRAVEINIFADLTISKRQKFSFFSKALEEVRKSLMNETTVFVSGKLEIKMYVSNIS
jgi:hypothetical protein